MHELAADEVRLGYIKYTLQAALEGCIAAAHHVCSSEGWGPPKDNADAMKVLARNHVLDSELADVMADAVRFRNVLVHLYDKVDDERTLAHLQRLHILDAFIALWPRSSTDAPRQRGQTAKPQHPHPGAHP